MLPLLAAVTLLPAGFSQAKLLELGDFDGFPSAGSQMDSRIKLGAAVDAESVPEDGGGLLDQLLRLLANSTATTDDANGLDDEDGAVVPPIIAVGGTHSILVTVTNATSSNVYLNAWMDFNGDGALNDTLVTTTGGEKLTSQITIAPGVNSEVRTISFTVPSTATTGTARGLRIRLTDVSAPGPGGESGKGEVEDYTLDLATPGFCYGVSEGSLYEINVATGTGKYIAPLAFPGSGNSLAFTSQLGSDGVLIYSTGESDDMRLGVWDRATGASNIAGNLASFGGPSRGVLRCGAWYGGKYWFIPNNTDDLWSVTFTGTSGNYRINTVQKVSDLWNNNRSHTYGDFIVRPDGKMQAIGTRTGGSPEYYTASLAVASPKATLAGTPPVMQNGIALGLDGKIYGGLGLETANRDWYVLNSSNGSIVSKVGASNLTDVSDMTLAVPWPAPANNPLLDYGDSALLPLAGSLRVNSIRLGGIVDGESAAIANADATGDDTSGSDDEDGAVMPELLVTGAPASIPVSVFNNSAAAAWLSAWIDFNGDGVLNDAPLSVPGGERLMDQTAINPSSGPVALTVSFTVPDEIASGGSLSVRFRLNNVSSAGPSGVVGSGEVEDYLVPAVSVRTQAVMEVRPAGAKDWGTHIAVQAGAAVDYRLTVRNTGALPVKDPVIVELLPAPGDTGTVELAPRGSAWRMLLTGPAGVPAGVEASYSLVQNPQRREVLLQDPAGSVPAGWFVLPANPGTVRAVKFDATGLTLAPGEEFAVTWSAAVPWDAAALTTAVNSAGVSVALADSGQRLPGRESSPAVVQALSTAGELYGDRVWHDLNNDGLQSPGEPGVNGIRIELYRDNGDGRPDPYSDLFVAATNTATIDGQAGAYRFGHFPPGSYFAALALSDSWGFSTPDTGADDAADSDAVEIIRAGRRTGLMPVTAIDSGESDLTWDAGLRDLSGTPAVWTMAETGSGMILGGRFTRSHGVPRNNIVKVNAGGAVDTSFDPGSGFDGTVRSVAIRDDGLILVAGEFTSYNGYPAAGVALLSPSGAGIPGIAQPDACMVHWAGAAGQNMYLAGCFSRIGGVLCGNAARLNADGSVDTGFTAGKGANGPVYCGAVLADGGVYFGGGFTKYNGASCGGIVKLNSDGSLDESFNAGGGAAGEVFSIHLVEDGRIHLTGNFRSFNGTACNGAVRLGRDGKVDPTLKPSSLAVESINSSN